MNIHKFQNGTCTKCGCDKAAIDYFGWSCSGRSITHLYVNDTCINCGFCKAVIRYFDWPCRLDYRRAQVDKAVYRSHDERAQGGRRSGHFCEHQTQLQQFTDDEIRYGELLGLKGQVTKSDIKCAYREQASLYHPDKVAHLALEIQELATERMREINQAFEYFKNKYGV
jgi:DnaJ domain